MAAILWRGIALPMLIAGLMGGLVMLVNFLTVSPFHPEIGGAIGAGVFIGWILRDGRS